MGHVRRLGANCPLTPSRRSARQGSHHDCRIYTEWTLVTRPSDSLHVADACCSDVIQSSRVPHNAVSTSFRDACRKTSERPPLAALVVPVAAVRRVEPLA